MGSLSVVAEEARLVCILCGDGVRPAVSFVLSPPCTVGGTAGHAVEGDGRSSTPTSSEVEPLCSAPYTGTGETWAGALGLALLFR